MRIASNTIELAAALRKEIEQLTSDEGAVRDTLEGEVDLDGVLDYLIAGVASDSAMVEAIKLHNAAMAKRSERLKERIVKQRELIARALIVSGWDRRERPLATVSMSKKAAAIGKLDEAILPARFWRQPDPVVDRDALLKALRDGEAIPGATLADDQLILQIRGA